MTLIKRLSLSRESDSDVFLPLRGGKKKIPIKTHFNDLWLDEGILELGFKKLRFPTK